MSDERPKTPIPEPDAPASADEVAASKRLREALEDLENVASKSDDLDLVRSLRAAWSPDALDESAHAAMLDDMPISAEEMRLAAKLRDGLASNDVVTALRSAHAPAELAKREHETIIESALVQKQGAKVVALRPRPARITIVATTTVLALAASVVFWISNVGSRAEAPLAKARSTQPLFDEPFKAGETSARIDRIAMARASDYRNNRFAKWGVR